jgi:hypothetical protein
MFKAFNSISIRESVISEARSKFLYELYWWMEQEKYVGCNGNMLRLCNYLRDLIIVARKYLMDETYITIEAVRIRMFNI